MADDGRVVFRIEGDSSAFEQSLSRLGETARKALSDACRAADDPARSAGQRVAGAVSGAMAKVPEGAAQAAQAAGSQVVGASEHAASQAVAAANRAASTAARMSSNTVDEVASRVYGALQRPVTAVQDFGSRARATFAQVGQSLSQAFASTAPGRALSAVATKASAAGASVRTAMGNAATTTKTGFAAACASVKGVLKGVGTFVSSKLPPGFGAAMAKLPVAVGAVAGKVSSAIGGIVSKAKSLLSRGGSEGGSQMGEGISQGLSAKAVAIGGIVSNIVTGAMSKLADVAKSAMSGAFGGSADFEQYAGGAAKIFEGMDQAQILRDAQDAYVDLNMSANEYMASINQTGATFAQTMGSQKGYETARSGMKSISDYATGTGRSISELNEKYSMITRSTSSYQSIADQFAGILPQTNKDFLEQAQAAGFLEGKYKSLTDVPVAEYQEAVTKMLEQGVAAQNLAGNTAHESAKTVSGSLLMLRGAWANWLTSLGSDEMDVGEMTSRLTDSLAAVARNCVPRVIQIGQSVISALPGMATQVAGALGATIVPILDKQFGGLGTRLRQAATKVAMSWSGAFEAAGPALSAFGTAVSGVATSALPLLADAAAGLGPILSDIAQAALPPLTAALGTLGAWITENRPQIQDLGAKFGEFAAKVSGVLGGALNAVMPVLTGLASVALPLLTSGLGLVMGAIDAVSGVLGFLWNSTEPVRNALGDVLAGVVLPALCAGLDLVSGALTSMGDWFTSVTEGAKGAFQGLVDFVTPLVEGLGGIIGGIGSFIQDPVGTIKGGVAEMCSAFTGGQATVAGASSAMAASAQAGAGQIGPSLQSAGQTGVSGLSAAISKGQVGVASSTKQVARASQQQIDPLPQQFQNKGSAAGQGLANGIGSKQGAVQSAGNSLSSAASSMKNGDSYSWGTHMGQNFANGINSQAGAVEAAARRLASAAASNLKHTTPKEGPLRHDDVWGEHLGRNIAGGMARAARLVREQSEGYATSIAAATGLARLTSHGGWAGAYAAQGMAMARQEARTASAGVAASAAGAALTGRLDAILAAVEAGQVITVDNRELARTMRRYA